MNTIVPQTIENNVSVSTPNFKSRNTPPEMTSIKRYPGYEVRRYDVEASRGKKWGVGLASLAVPGLGQVINGSWGKGIAFFAGAILLPAFVAAESVASSILGGMRGSAKMAKMGILGGLAAVASAIGFRIWSIIDATKCAKSEAIQVIPRNNDKANVNKVI